MTSALKHCFGGPDQCCWFMLIVAIAKYIPSLMFPWQMCARPVDHWMKGIILFSDLWLLDLLDGIRTTHFVFFPERIPSVWVIRTFQLDVLVCFLCTVKRRKSGYWLRNTVCLGLLTKHLLAKSIEEEIKEKQVYFGFFLQKTQEVRKSDKRPVDLSLSSLWTRCARKGRDSGEGSLTEQILTPMCQVSPFLVYFISIRSHVTDVTQCFEPSAVQINLHKILS